LLFIAIFGALVATGYLEWKARETIKTAREERLSLAQADKALITFATINHRLPCPDTNRDGLEDCGANDQKGWLPSLTLQLAGADPGVSTGQLRYLVQRGAATFDLASLDDDWRPLEYDDGAPANFNAIRATGAGAYPANILTLADLCQRLEVGTGTTLTAGMAQVVSAPARAVAYAVVHPGIADADGNGSLFEGVNATATGNNFEDPAKTPLLADYDDRVLERSFTSLQSAFNCQPLLQSINTVALGLDVVAQVEDMRQGNITSAQQAITFAALGAALTGAALATSIVEAISDTGNAIADGVLCGISLGLAVNACAAIGIHVGAAVAAGISTVTSIATIVLSVAASAAAAGALVLANSSVDASSLTCPTIDVAGPLASATAERDAAITSRNSLQAELTAKQNELPIAITARDNALFFWLRDVRGGFSSSSIDFRYTNLVNAAEAWYTANQTAIGTGLRRTDLQDTVNNATTLVAQYDAQLANRPAAIAALQAQIASLETQIAATPDGPAKEALRLDLASANGRLSLVNNPDQSILVDERARAEAARLQAVGDLAAAIAADNTAQTNLTTNRTNYQDAYDLMLDRAFGPYTIGATLPPTLACTERNAVPPVTCPAGSIATRPNVVVRVSNVFGFGGNAGVFRPQPESRFIRPKTIQQEIDALQIRVNAAIDRVTRAQGLVNNLQNQVDNPPACIITGTGVTPWSPAAADPLLQGVDTKGATR
jgi:hypothetical protein